MLAGVYVDKKKNGSLNYRASITIDKKHISLGSYPTEKEANASYTLAHKVYSNTRYTISSYRSTYPLSFDKYVILINLRDNKIYFPTPIYIRKRDFSYFLSPSEELKFDMDDLFYFSNKKIMKRGSHLFISDYGMQVSLKERFGIRSFSVENRDYVFVNGNNLDYRRENIEIINRYIGVRRIEKKMKVSYKVIIHIKSNYVVGIYHSENEAAIAYNKAADIIIKNGFDKKYTLNYVDEISHKEYAEIYTNVKISPTIYSLTP